MVNVGMNSENLTKKYQYEHCVVNGDYSHNTQWAFFEMHSMIPQNISLPKVDDFNMTFFYRLPNALIIPLKKTELVNRKYQI